MCPGDLIGPGSLDYWIKGNKLLRDLTCSFPPGTLTGIMGPSGCGKTILLDLMSGREKVGEFSGVRMVNGEAMPMDRFRAVMRQQAYVRQVRRTRVSRCLVCPRLVTAVRVDRARALQEDTFFEELTVRDTLLYSAMLGLPESTSLQEKMDRVDAVLEEIGLTACAHAKVGGVKFKGISGGQKRRLSIAIELIRTPSIMLMDEPTSGLDATTSLKLIRTLADLAQQGNRAIIASIQQPRAEIFEALDQILLLGTGGCVVYFGPAKDCVASMSASGLEIDPKDYDNPGGMPLHSPPLSAPRARRTPLTPPRSR